MEGEAQALMWKYTEYDLQCGGAEYTERMEPSAVDYYIDSLFDDGDTIKVRVVDGEFVLYTTTSNDYAIKFTRVS